MTAWYNEPDNFAAGMLRNLIAGGHIAPGVVDQRDIREVEAYELAEFTQCHFFAGCGVWSYAARRAGWRDDERFWTGSCPCPPFSQAGKGQTCPRCGSRHNLCHPRRTGHFICLACGYDRHADDRHLWPEFARIIRDGKPPIVLGEQVASANGRIWLATVSADMETMGYAFAGADLCAAGFDGAHIRQRNYFVGLEFAGCGMLQSWEHGGNDTGSTRSIDRKTQQFERRGADNRVDGAISGLAYDDARFQIGSPYSHKQRTLRNQRNAPPSSELSGGLVDDDDDRGLEAWERDYQATRYRFSVAAADSNDTARYADAAVLGRTAADWLYCRDGRWRPVEPGTFPLVDAAPSRVGRLRTYGNALDAETATQFCRAVRSIVGI